MHKRKDKFLGFIVALLLFLTGMYLDTATEDVYFLYDLMGATALCTRSFHTDINNSKICEKEVLNECGGMEQQSIEIDLFLSWLHTDRVSLSLGKFHGYSGTIQPFAQTLDGLVTNYMHQSDGKK